MSDDNWKHRSKGMRCGTCVYFVEKPVLKPAVDKPGPGQGAPDLRGALGRCRRHAPCQVVLGFPSVFATDWCGDHKLDEERA